jgi:hypothetical protein
MEIPMPDPNNITVSAPGLSQNTDLHTYDEVPNGENTTQELHAHMEDMKRKVREFQQTLDTKLIEFKIHCQRELENFNKTYKKSIADATADLNDMNFKYSAFNARMDNRLQDAASRISQTIVQQQTRLNEYISAKRTSFQSTIDEEIFMAVTKPMSDQVIPLIEQRDQLLKNRTQDALENLDATFNDYLNQLEQKGEQLTLTKTQEEFPQESHAPTSWPTHHQPVQEQRHVQVTDQWGTTHSQARSQYPNNTQLPPPPQFSSM